MTGDRGGPDPHQPKRSLGQNFLIDPNLQRKIVDALELRADDEVLEIGPGQGALTHHIAGRVRRLVLVELDDDLAARLRAEFGGDLSVEVVHADILEVELASVLQAPTAAKVIGNIPYNITTPILFHLLERRPRPATILVMIQREVADRILAAPGNKTYGALTVGIQAVADVQRVLNVSRNAFRPVPDVESTVIRIVPRRSPLASEDERAVRDLTRLAFGRRRKQFQRILRDALNITAEEVEALGREARLDLTARPETFSPLQFVALAVVLRTKGFLGG